MGNVTRVSPPATTGGAGMSFEQHVGAYWLAAVFQSEHLALLLGSGFTKAVSQ